MAPLGHTVCVKLTPDIKRRLCLRTLEDFTVEELTAIARRYRARLPARWTSPAHVTINAAVAHAVLGVLAPGVDASVLLPLPRSEDDYDICFAR